MRIIPLSLILGILGSLLATLPTSAQDYDLENWNFADNSAHSSVEYVIQDNESSPSIQQSTYHVYGDNDAGASPSAPSVAPSQEWNDIDDSGSCNASYNLRTRQGSWVAGADVLFIRRHHSDSKAFTHKWTTTANGVTTNRDETIYFDSTYDASFRPYIAYRLCDCCSELRFTYWNLSDSSSNSVTNQTGSTYSNFEIDVVNAGEVITSTTSMDSNIFDVEFSRCIQMGDDFCCGCPRWDLQWSAGLRVADVQSGYSIQEFVNNDRADITASFTGIGPRIGMQGKRYFGSCGQFSIDSSFDIALLVGEFNHELKRTTASGNSVELYTGSTTRTTPVIDLELGASWQVRPQWTLSAGWLFQAWWDITAMEDEIDGTLNFSRDDANITSWDGFMLRLEGTY